MVAWDTVAMKHVDALWQYCHEWTCRKIALLPLHSYVGIWPYCHAMCSIASKKSCNVTNLVARVTIATFICWWQKKVMQRIIVRANRWKMQWLIVRGTRWKMHRIIVGGNIWKMQWIIFCGSRWKRQLIIVGGRHVIQQHKVCGNNVYCNNKKWIHSSLLQQGHFGQRLFNFFS